MTRAQNPFPAQATSDGFQQISGTCSEAVKVHLRSGNLLIKTTVASVPTIGLPLELVLSYNAQDTVLGTVGHRWRHTWMANLNIGSTLITYTDATGRQFNYTGSGSSWSLQLSTSYYFDGTLAPSGSHWTITRLNGRVYTFDSTGALLSVQDAHGNTTSLTYSAGLLTSVSDPTGRTLTLGYSGSLLTSVTDPNGNQTLLGYDTTNTNLTSVSGPDGCSLMYGYGSTPANHLVVLRTDGRGNSYGYAYDSSNRVVTINSPDSQLTYTYDTVTENSGDGYTISLSRTTLNVPTGQWEYRFDTNGNLWRTIDPLGHMRHYVFGSQQALQYQSSGFPYITASNNDWGPRDNVNNNVHTSIYDSYNNLLYDTDESGVTTAYQYDPANHVDLLSVYPGQANSTVQGNWVGEYGADGYLLCAFSAGTDLTSLPGYVASIVPSNVSGSPNFTRTNATVSTYSLSCDPSAIVSPTTGRREVGLWESPADGTHPCAFNATINLQGSHGHAFNLSLYTASADINQYVNNNPIQYHEQTGRNASLEVHDTDPDTGLARTQTFTVTNNSAGVWVTFPVYGDATHPIVVKVTATNLVTASISAIAFDPYDSHRVVRTYDSRHDVLTVTDGVNAPKQTINTYNSNGTLATTTDANNNLTQFFYEDAHLNLTRIVDAASGTTRMTFDNNGNLLSREDQNNHTWSYQYDGKNRLIRVTDPLSNVSQLAYDNAGNLVQVTDANSHVTTYRYTAANRLSAIIDPLGNTTALTYDPRGNVQTVTDPLNRVTTYAWDGAGNLVKVTMPDGTVTTNAYDALNRLAAITSPNGNQTDPANINLLGAGNLILNGGAETVDPFIANQPRHWHASSPGSSRDTTVSHSGTASMKLSVGGQQNWSQSEVNLPAGATALLSYWARPDGSTNTITIQAGVQYNSFNIAPYTAQSPTKTLPTSSTTWQSPPAFRFTVPGDSQFGRYPVNSVLLYGQSAPGAATAWYDDVTLYALSTAFNYDGAGRVRATQTPDGAVTQKLWDRFGRLGGLVDALGATTTLSYNGLDQLTLVTDPLGNTTAYAWDAVGNLVSVTDAKGNTTTYQYDALNRLQTITYPDTSTEAFSYDAASNLTGYTNNRSQSRILAYDNANRLTLVTYTTDSSTVAFTYDSVGNVLSRTERNGDQARFTYDVNNRLVGVVRSAGSSSSSAPWNQTRQLDGVGNRLKFSSSTNGASIGTSRYDSGTYGDIQAFWSASYDLMNRLSDMIDAQGNSILPGYDVEGRPIRYSYAQTSSNLVTQAVFDLMGRLLNQATSTSSSTLLAIDCAYDPNGNRTTVATGNDTFDYRIDSAGRLVQETTNQFSERSADRFMRGTASAVETASGELSLLGLTDTFAGSVLNHDRWRMTMTSSDLTGFEIRQKNNALVLAFPRGYTDLIFAYSVGTSYTIPYDGISTSTTAWGGLEHRALLVGDFDVQVSFADFQYGEAILMVAANPLETYTSGDYFQIMRDRAYDCYREISGGTSSTNNTVAKSDTSGILRITRTGTSYGAWFWNSGTASWNQVGPSVTLGSEAMYVSLQLKTYPYGYGNVTFSNFTLNVPANTYVASGTYTSTVCDADRSVTWNTLNILSTVPGGCGVSAQVAVSNSPNGPWTFVGPDGTSGTTFGASGGTLPSLSGRYACYQLTLTGSGASTPTVSGVDMLYTGTNTSSSVSYTYDGASNMTQKITQTPSGGGTIITETRDHGTGWPSTDNINSLNQIVRNDVNTVVTSPPSNTTVTWRFTFDLSGNMKTRTDGTNLTTYYWDEDNRLTSVSLPGGATVSYTYDSLSRMLTRTDSTGTTTFVWDGMDCVQETDQAGGVTRYYVVGGVLRSFDRTVSGVTSTYQVHCDALGSVRKVTDSTGSVVATFDTDGFGNSLASSSDSVPNGGLQYRFVGAYGVRWDAGTGLYFMRQRWYDPSVSIFLSREPLAVGLTQAGSPLTGLYVRDLDVSMYRYVKANPTSFIDPSGEKVYPKDACAARMIARLLLTKKGRELYDALERSPKKIYIRCRKPPNGKPGECYAPGGDEDFGPGPHHELRDPVVIVDVDPNAFTDIDPTQQLAHELGHVYHWLYYPDEEFHWRQLPNATQIEEHWTRDHWEYPIGWQLRRLPRW